MLELGGRVVKNVAGYDLVKLAVGSSGRLGIVTSATVLLHPLPVRDVTLLYQTPRLALAVGAGPLTRHGTAAHPGAGAARRPRRGADRGRAPARLARGRSGIGANPQRAAWDGRPAGAWRARLQPGWFAALERFEDDAAAVARVSHLPSRLGDLVEPAVECGTVAAHVSLGVLRVAVRGPGASAAAVFDALTRLRDNVAQAGATFRVSRANIPRWPAPEPAAAPGVLALTRGIVDSFDPAGVLSRPAS